MDNKPAKRKKTGGIQKGYRYQKTLEFKERCDANGFIIVEEYIKLYNNIKDPDKKRSILSEMAKYCYAIPQDHSPSNLEETNDDDDTNEEHSIRDILEAIDVTPKK